MIFRALRHNHAVQHWPSKKLARWKVKEMKYAGPEITGMHSALVVVQSNTKLGPIIDSLLVPITTIGAYEADE
jgi:hypothetical protein